MEDTIFGQGNYTMQEVKILTGISVQKISRWVFGTKNSAPLLTPSFPDKENGKYRILSFNNLMECRFIDAFLSKGVKMHYIKKAIENSKTYFENKKHPFCYGKFRTDGKHVIEESFPEYWNYTNRNREMNETIEGFLDDVYDGIFFEKTPEEAIDYWQPMKTCPNVVVDPKYQFGSPTVQGRQLRPDTIYYAYIAEGGDLEDIDEKYLNVVADDYNIAPEIAKQCLRFEEKYKLAA